MHKGGAALKRRRSFPMRTRDYASFGEFWRRGGGGVLLKTKSAFTESRIKRPLLQILMGSLKISASLGRRTSVLLTFAFIEQMG